MVRRVAGEAAAPLSRLVELPGRGVTRVWECPGPRRAETLMLIHGVAVTAELNWGKAFAPLARHFRVVAADLRGHGGGIRAGSRFRLEDCADDVAALAGVLGIGTCMAVGYSMGGMVAQLLARRHPSLLSGLVLCSTAGNVRESPAEMLAALALPTTAAALRWNPLLQMMSAELLGMTLLGHVDDPATARWARAELSRTTLASAVSAIQAVCEFNSDGWVSQAGCPGRGGRHHPGPHRAGGPPAQAGPGDPGRVRPRGAGRSWGVHQRAAAVRPGAARGMLVGGDGPRWRHARPAGPK